MLCVPVQAESSPITLESLLEEMSQEATLAEWPSEQPYQLLQASSYSRESVDAKTAAEDGKFRPESGRDWGKGWFENHDFGNFLREEMNGNRKEFVMMEDEGPGVVVRFWAAYGGRPDIVGGTYRIYIDGAETPVISLFHKDLLGGNGLIGKPFSFLAPEESENPTWKGRNLVLPIPYAKSCKITYEAKEGASNDEWNGHYYAINYRKYPSGTKVESFDQDSLKKYQKAIHQAGQTLIADKELNSVSTAYQSAKLATNQYLTLDLKGSKAITALRCLIDAKDMEQALRSTVLEISFDGHNTVWCPLGQFYGIGYKRVPNKSFYINCDADGLMASHWLMPFGKEAKVTLRNYGKEPIEVELFQVYTRPYNWGENSMYFHAAWTETQKMDTNIKRDYNYISIEGKGVFVGDNLTVYNTHPDWWGEGDEKIYVDGEDFPSHFGTGTEDYYSYAWCRPQRFYHINVTQPLGDGNKAVGLSTNNRYRLLDAIPFTRSFQFDMEIWHPFYAKMNYSPATFWYAFAGAKWNHRPDVEKVKRPVAKTKEDVISPSN